MSECEHRQWANYTILGEKHSMCVECGLSWKGSKRMSTGTAVKKIWDPKTLPPPKHYLRRNTKVVGWNGHSNWEFREWEALTTKGIVKSWHDAARLIAKWNTGTVGTAWEFRLPTHCERCYTECNETYPSLGLDGMIGKHVCNACHMEGVKLKQEEQKQMKCLKCGIYTHKAYMNGTLCSGCFKIKNQSILAEAKAKGVNKIRTVGEIWKFSTANAPFQSEQWGYQGTAKSPYVITHYFNKVDGSTTSDGWACGCMSFTRNVPRTPCKHILNVMLKEGKTPTGASAKAAKVSALLTDDDAKAFEKWKREQAEKGEVKPTAGAELQLFGAQGRKFR
jgi:hypothetical protein